MHYFRYIQQLALLGSQKFSKHRNTLILINNICTIILDYEFPTTFKHSAGVQGGTSGKTSNTFKWQYYHSRCDIFVNFFTNGDSFHFLQFTCHIFE